MKKLPFTLLFLSFAAGLAAQAPRLVVPIGHTNRVTSVAFSPDGQLVLTGSWDGTAKLWDVSGREIQSFRGHASGVSSVAFSPDGQKVVTGSFDNTVKLWSLSGGEPLTLKHTSHVNSVAFSPDGQQVLTGSGDGTVKLWKVSGGLIKSFQAHASELSSVAFSPDGKNVLTGSWDGNAKLWDLSGSPIKTFPGTASLVTSVAFSPDGQKVLTGSGDGMAKLWNVSGGAPLILEHTSYINSVAFSPDGQTVLTGSRDGMVKLWNLSGSVVNSFSAHASVVSSVAFSPDGQSVLTGSWDNAAKLWNLSGREMQSFRGHAFPVLSAVFSPDGQKILMGSKDGTAKLWNLPGRAIQSFKGHASGVSSAVFSPDGQQVLTGSADSTAKLWSLTGLETKSFRHGAQVLSVSFSPDGQQALTGSADSTAKLWSLAGLETKNLRHEGQVLSVAFSPDGQQALTGSTDNMAKLWNLKNSDAPALMRHASAVSSVAFSPDGKKILTGSFDKTAKLWALPGSLDQTFTGHADGVTSVAFSPDGQQVLTGSGDRTAKRWSLSVRDTLTFRGHAFFVRSVAFSPDGQKVLTGSEDNTAKIWDAKTGICLATLIALDTSEWVVTTPSGLFDASPGAMNLMYFLQGLEVIELEQLKERYYEPGLLSKLMGFSNEPMRSVAAFEAIAMYPSVQLRLDSAKHQLRIALQPRNGGMGKLSIFVNDKEIIEDALQGAGPSRSRDTSIVLDLEPFARYFLSDTFNTISVRAYNRENWLRSPLHSLSYRPEFVGSKGGPGQTASPSPFRKKRNPALHLLLVGVHDYAGTTLDLKYTAKDAEDMAAALRQAGGELFTADSVFVHLLSTSPGKLQPSKANIQAAFEAIAAKAKAEDILLAYFSGHGVNYGEAEKSLFYFLTMETGSFDLSDPGIRAARAISSDELTRWINKVPAQKQVLIVDACNSGKMVEDMGAGGKSLTASQIRALDRMKDRTGMFILSGSAADQKSFEASKFRQSLLTYSLLEAMQGVALNLDRDIDVMRLFDQARTRVRELAAELRLVQEPVPNYPRNAGTIFIGRVNENVKIEPARAGAVFVGSAFQDETQFNDPLNLADAVNNYLREQDAEGAGFLFFDLKNIPDAYSIKGLYTLSGDAVTVRARLFKGKAQVGEVVTIKGSASATPALVEAIVGKVQGMVK
jgi:WD40 repeat protein